MSSPSTTPRQPTTKTLPSAPKKPNISRTEKKSEVEEPSICKDSSCLLVHDLSTPCQNSFPVHTWKSEKEPPCKQSSTAKRMVCFTNLESDPLPKKQRTNDTNGASRKQNKETWRVSKTTSQDSIFAIWNAFEAYENGIQELLMETWNMSGGGDQPVLAKAENSGKTIPTIIQNRLISGGMDMRIKMLSELRKLTPWLANGWQVSSKSGAIAIPSQPKSKEGPCEESDQTRSS